MFWEEASMLKLTNIYMILNIIIAIGYMEVMQMSAFGNSSELILFIANDGNDNWSGRIAVPNAARNDGPFATLERARDEIRKLKQAGEMPKGGVTVELHGGVYQREQPLELNEADSGTKDAPVVYRARRGEEVRLVGGRVVTGFQPVTDPAVLERLSPEARGNVFQADLKALGITDFGEVKRGGIELFFGDKPMTLARWPKEGFVRIVDLVGGDPVDVRGTKGDKIGKFMYEGDRPKRWVGEKDVWVHGYWFWDWSDQRHKVESIDTESRVISVSCRNWTCPASGMWTETQVSFTSGRQHPLKKAARWYPSWIH
jgi:hypothetical protein